MGGRMEDLKDTLNENAAFYREQERRITAQLLALWEGLPRKWKSLIRKSLARVKDMMPLEQGIIERLMDLLR